MEIDYKKEALRMLEIVCREDWMTDNDWQEFITVYENYDVIKKDRPSIEDMAEALKKGVENGYSIDQQIEMTKVIHKK